MPSRAFIRRRPKTDVSRLAHYIAASAFSAFLSVAAEPVQVTFLGGYDPDLPESAATRQIVSFARRESEFQPVKWGGLTLPGAGGRAPFMLATAGGTAPDVYYVWFHIIRHDIDQGFLHPLNEWIDREQWNQVPELWRRVATGPDGKIYGLPVSGMDLYGIIYRKDLVEQAGLDPEYTPETWDEFYAWCQKLTLPRKTITGSKIQQGQRAFGITPSPWAWIPWLQAAGGSPVVQIKDGQTYPMELPLQPPVEWQAAFDSPEAVAAAEFMRKLLWAPWSRPEAPDEIIHGVARPLPVLDTEAFMLGEVVALFAGTEQIEKFTQDLNLPPEKIGIMPVPGMNRKLKPVLQGHKHFYGMTSQAGRRPPRERTMVFRAIEQLCGSEVRDAAIRQKVAEGQGRWCNPADLRRLGLSEHIGDIPPGIRRFYERLEKDEIVIRTEPFAGFWQGVSDLLQRRVIERLLADEGAVFDVKTALASVNTEANRGLMFRVSETELAARRPLARVLVGIAAVVILICLFLIVRTAPPETFAQRAERNKPKSLIPWIMLAPALISIALWSYYPLLRGTVMAFQNYKIAGETTWAGLDNIILVAVDPVFWASVLRTLKFVGLTLVIGFFTPIVLAFLLNEIPRGKIFFRTVYFLPHLTSALVITLLWKMMYDPTENGMLNQFLMSMGLPKQSWLLDPSLAMVCCIIPGVWASAGVASLIYGAALHALPPDYYEAAAIDGAGFRSRIRHIMLPQILPLMVINFVGAFIAAFQGMGSIFLLTFGGPGDSTTVVSLAIWKEAYNNLRFGTATTMAWFLGTGLISFTYLQIRILRRVEYRRPSGN